MPLADRDYMRDEHPPSCTCVSCVRGRSERFSKKNKQLPKSSFKSSSSSPTGEPPTSELDLALAYDFEKKVSQVRSKEGFMKVLMGWLLVLLLIGVPTLVIASTASMVWPQTIVSIVPKAFGALHILPTKVDTAGMEKAIFMLVNQERLNKGLSQLLWNESLAQYARKHGSDMVIAGDLYHNEAELAKLQAGENALMLSRFCGGFILLPYPVGLAFYRTDGELYREAVNSWIKSPGHHSNMLNSGYRYTGIGVAVA
ncbi:MAG: CAP domain-containing protein, partial [Proteobacteria bacterium]|nr:CAP domain-containing protein [Pseudomonadota bacterium]